MNYEKRNTPSNQSAGLGLLLAVTSSLFLLVGPQKAAAQQYYDSVSRFLDKSSMWRNNFYNDIIRANSGSFGRVSAEGSRVCPDYVVIEIVPPHTRFVQEAGHRVEIGRAHVR